MLEILNYLWEIFNGPKADDEQQNTTNMLELESEESAHREEINKEKA